MGTRIIKLHGGPMHGKKIELPDDQDHFHIAGPADVPDDFVLSAADMTAQVPYKEGMYSKVIGHADDFEWDGWRGHDD
jgi:hypothetical protein